MWRSSFWASGLPARPPARTPAHPRSPFAHFAHSAQVLEGADAVKMVVTSRASFPPDGELSSLLATYEVPPVGEGAMEGLVRRWVALLVAAG